MSQRGPDFRPQLQPLSGIRIPVSGAGQGAKVHDNPNDYRHLPCLRVW